MKAKTYITHKLALKPKELRGIINVLKIGLERYSRDNANEPDKDVARQFIGQFEELQNGVGHPPIAND